MRRGPAHWPTAFGWRSAGILGFLFATCAPPLAAPPAAPDGGAGPPDSRPPGITEAPIASPPAAPAVPAGPTAAPAPTVTPGPGAAEADITAQGTPTASWMRDQVQNAVDGNLELTWNSTRLPPEWFAILFPRPYAISRLELVVSQTPPGDTVHEVWLGLGPDLALQERIGPARTADRQVLTVRVEPSRIASRVVIRTLASPSHVAWREVRVFGAPAEAPPPPARARLQPFSRGNLELPTGIVSPRDGSGRLFVLEQRGRIRVLDSSGAVASQPFLDLTAQVSCCTERGLLGLAFPPNYAQTRSFYVAYTSAARPNIPLGALVVSRFFVGADSNRADPTREEVLLVVPQPHEAHNGGHLEFGPRDGLLYVGLGDGGPGGGGEERSQDLGVWLGKILRIDPESNRPGYATPRDNPFVSTAGARPEIWALGLRNPWGFTFDWATGDLYLADAGETEWEEVNVQPATSRGGENYGWPRLEGRHCFRALRCDPTGTTPPVAEYHHVEGCVIVGGAVARSPSYRQLQGAFLFADFCSGRVYTLRSTDAAWTAALLLEAGFPISSLGRDETGSVYVADYGQGRIFRLEEL